MTDRPPRFLTIPQVADELATSPAQSTALVKRGDLPALKLGGRGQWRIERSELEEYIARAYEETLRELAERRASAEARSDEFDPSDYQADDDYRQEEGGEG